MGELTASALALNFLGLTTTIRPLPPSHVTILEPFSRSISGLTRTATLKALRSRVRFPPPVETRDDSSRDSSLLLKIQITGRRRGGGYRNDARGTTAAKRQGLGSEARYPIPGRHQRLDIRSDQK